MVSSSKSTTFVFLLVVFISISLNNSLAYTNQVAAAKKVFVEDDENGFTMTKGSSLTSINHKDSLNEVWKGKMEGRKMSKEGKKKEEEEGLMKSGGTTRSNGNSSSEYSVGNIRHKGLQGIGRKMRMQRKLRTRSSYSSSSNQDNNIPAGSFMALNADYHMARPHPPKNN